MDINVAISKAQALVQGNPLAFVCGRGPDRTLSDALNRVMLADPIGFMCAIMNGEPLLAYRLEPVKQRYRGRKPTGGKHTGTRRVLRAEIQIEDGVRVMAEYWTPSLADRRYAAVALIEFIRGQSRASHAVDPDPAHTAQIEAAAALGD